MKPLQQLPQGRSLARLAAEIQTPENHLRNLLQAPGRFEEMSVSGGGLFLDFSRQRITGQVKKELIDLAKTRRAVEQFNEMASGKIVNPTEKRSALHTACRRFTNEAVKAGDVDVMPEITRIREQIRQFTDDVHQGRIVGSTGRRFSHVVVIGIGGSYLGTEFIAEALKPYGDKGLDLYFLANVCPDNFSRVAASVDLEKTLWIVISKSYTTAETLANAALARSAMEAAGLDPTKHMATVTAKGSPGDLPADGPSSVLAAFHMFDFIGGRYSVTSAVGGVPLSLVLGYEVFQQVLEGAHEMDRHAATADPAQNLPLLSALMTIWNKDFLHYPALGIIPYASALSRLPAHIQQLAMESCGKGVTATGETLDRPAGIIIFGEPGTCAQHSFFQLAHQGPGFPLEFIGAKKPQASGSSPYYNGVTNHQELWSNLIAQPQALAMGKDSDDPARRFEGNRPSSTVILPDLEPRSMGRLLAYFEAKTVFEGFLWGINPFDQFGVELGKKLAKQVREQMARKNQNPDHGFDSADPYAKPYLDMLFEEK